MTADFCPEGCYWACEHRDPWAAFDVTVGSEPTPLTPDILREALEPGGAFNPEPPWSSRLEETAAPWTLRLRAMYGEATAAVHENLKRSGLLD